MNAGQTSAAQPETPSRSSAFEWYSHQFETNINERGNWLTRQWGRARGLSNRIRERSGIKREFRALQKEWLGELAGKSVLDLGCGQGNNLSIHMAREAAEYLAFDLSEPAIAKLREKLDAGGLGNARAVAGDFLVADASYGPFDIVYANSVLHAFHPAETILNPLFERMTPGGRLVTMEPMATSWLVWAVRTIAKQVRTDADFNWPFTRRDFETIQRYFEIEAIHGFFGWSKWAIPLGIIPGMEPAATRLVRSLHEVDKRRSDRLGSGLWRCNSVTMLLRRRVAVNDAEKATPVE